MKKLQAEGRLEESKKVLGWILNTHSLQILLPDEKFRDWSIDIKKMLSAKKSHHKFLETLIGRINHVACICHYMGRLYHAFYRSSSNGGWTSFTDNELSDLETMFKFLSAAQYVFSMNNLVFRKPTVIYRSDASKFRLGGYNLISGIAWRLELPVDCQLRSSLNSLEFLACLIAIWIDDFHQVLLPESCVLSQTDSTSALGWLRKSNFADKVDEMVQLSTARKLADIMLSSNIGLFSQWFPGEENVVADSLSRDFHLSDVDLSNLLLLHCPDQVPFGLKILPVPPDIISWLTCLLLSQPQEAPWTKALTRSIRAWVSFQRYLNSIGVIQDPFLDQFSSVQRTKILSAFAHAIWEGRFCDGPSIKTVKSKSIRAALDGVSQIYKLADRPDPRLDGNGRLTLLLQKQLRGYSSVDPAV